MSSGRILQDGYRKMVWIPNLGTIWPLNRTTSQPSLPAPPPSSTSEPPLNIHLTHTPTSSLQEQPKSHTSLVSSPTTPYLSVFWMSTGGRHPTVAGCVGRVGNF